MKKIITLLSIAFVSSINTLSAQGRVIEGRVVDEKDNPIQNVAITFNTQVNFAILTNSQGFFKSNIPCDTDTLTCEFGNYSKQNINIKGNNFVLIKLEQKVESERITAKIVKKINKPQKECVPIPEKDNGQFFTVMIKPYFFDGKNDIKNYFEKNINYPDSLFESNIQGTIKIGFTIDKTGKTSNPVLIKGVDKVVDALVISSILDMPKWKPAEFCGRNIDFYKEISIDIDITGSKED